jgi:hypothetical protein
VSGESEKTRLANVGESEQTRLANVGEFSESDQFFKKTILASTQIRQKWQISGEYSNSLNLPANSHCLIFISTRLKIQGRGCLEFFFKILRGVKAFRKNFGFYWQSFGIYLGVSYIYQSPFPPVCIYVH